MLDSWGVSSLSSSSVSVSEDEAELESLSEESVPDSGRTGVEGRVAGTEGAASGESVDRVR